MKNAELLRHFDEMEALEYDAREEARELFANYGMSIDLAIDIATGYFEGQWYYCETGSMIHYAEYLADELNDSIDEDGPYTVQECYNALTSSDWSVYTYGNTAILVSNF